MNFREYDILTLDFETYYGTKYSLSLQTMNTFKYIADEQFQIHSVGVKLNDGDTAYYDFHKGEREAFEQYLADLPENVALLAHNTAFDGFILHYHFDWHPTYYLDTASMSRGFFVGQSASLKNLAIRLFPNEASLRKKDTLESTFNVTVIEGELAEQFKAYCIRDVDLCYACFEVLLPYYPAAELDLIDWTLRCMCEPTLAVDIPLVEEEIDDQVETTTNAIAAAGLPADTLRSDKQFLAYLEDNNIDVEYKPNAKGEGEIPALSQKDWGYQRMVARHPELSAIWEARRLSKSNIQESRARWFKAVAEWNTGHMPVPLQYYGADTGRWSGSEKLNLQNLPRITGDPTSGRLRRSLHAQGDNVVIVRDLNNIEGRVLAWLAHETYLLNLFNSGGCPYLYMAESIYKVPHGTFNKQKHAGERQVGKVSVLGLGYGMGKDKFHVTMNTGPMGMNPIPTSIEQAAEIVNIYRSTNSKISRFWTTCNNYIERMASLAPGETWTDPRLPLTLHPNLIELPNGMCLQYVNLAGTPNSWGGYDFSFDPRGEGNRKKLYGGLLCENITQALARIIIAEQLLTIQTYLDETWGRDIARIVHMVHDELIVVAPERLAEEIYEKMGEIMSTPPSWGPTLPLKSEGGFAKEYSK